MIKIKKAGLMWLQGVRDTPNQMLPAPGATVFTDSEPVGSWDPAENAVAGEGRPIDRIKKVRELLAVQDTTQMFAYADPIRGPLKPLGDDVSWGAGSIAVVTVPAQKKPIKASTWPVRQQRDVEF